MDKEVFNNMMKNSIGNEKKVKKSFEFRKVVLKVSTTVFAAFVIATSLVGCVGYDRNTPQEQAIMQMNDIIEEYPFNLSDVRIFERNRLYSLLDKAGINKYEEKYGRRQYSCTKEDYMSVEGLDESYLYAVYASNDDKNQANEMAKALGYESLDDYLIKHKYVDQSNNPSYRYWQADDAIAMAKLLNEFNNSKGASK